jgi:UPF0042 nucleotide-binding protein
MIRIVSFPYSRDIPVEFVDYIIDARAFVNPKSTERLQRKTGRDNEYKNLLFLNPQNREAIVQVKSYVKELAEEYDNFSIGVGCFNGTHRSVAVADFCAKFLRRRGYDVDVFHIALGITPEGLVKSAGV